MSCDNTTPLTGKKISQLPFSDQLSANDLFVFVDVSENETKYTEYDTIVGFDSSGTNLSADNLGDAIKEVNDKVTSGGVSDHNMLAGLQGGTGGEYYHITSADYDVVVSISTGDGLVPVGGEQGQVLAKDTLLDFDYSWQDVSGASGGIDDVTSAGTYLREIGQWTHSDQFTSANYYNVVETDILLNEKADTSALDEYTTTVDFESHVDNTNIHYDMSAIDHIVIQNIGTYSHDLIDDHIENFLIHRPMIDSITSASTLWSSLQTQNELDDKEDYLGTGIDGQVLATSGLGDRYWTNDIGGELVLVDEGGNQGHALRTDGRINKVDIGTSAIDLSINDGGGEFPQGGAGSFAGFAEGYNTFVDGNAPGGHAEGYNTYANTDNGPGSHAEGSRTTSTGGASHAEGTDTNATGYGSHAEGANTHAEGAFSHAEGTSTTAIGDYSHAEGSGTISNGIYSHTEGYSTYSGGIDAHAEGSYTSATSTHSHAEGNNTLASGVASHAEGIDTHSFGPHSHAEGQVTIASGTASHSEGSGTEAIGIYSHAEGVETISEGSYSHSEGQNTVTKGSSSHAEGVSTSAIGDYTHTEGSHTKATAAHAHAEGRSTSATGVASHAEGLQTISIGSHSHAEGQYTSSTGDYSHAEGSDTFAIGDYSHAEGSRTSAIGAHSHSQNYKTTALGHNSHAEGYNTSAVGDYSHASGEGTIASSPHMYTTGRYNNPKVDDIYEIGVGVDDFTRTNAFEVTSAGIISAPQQNGNIINVDHLVTKKYHDDNTGGIDDVTSAGTYMRSIGVWVGSNIFDSDEYYNKIETDILLDGKSDTSALDNYTTTADFESHTSDIDIHYDMSAIDHTTIQNIGTNTHIQIDTHIGTSAIHIPMYDSLTSDSTIWSSDKIQSSLNDKEDYMGTQLSNGQVLASSGSDVRYWVNMGSDELVKISVNDLTTGYLDSKIIVGPGLSKTIVNPGSNEVIEIALIPPLYGTTANRPASPATYQEYFDTDLGYAITWNGSDWINSTGAIV